VNPVLALKAEEAKALGVAGAEVAKHYPAIANTFDPKLVAWYNLAQIVGFVYGPRVFAIYRGPPQAPPPHPVDDAPMHQTVQGAQPWPQH
jgi:hypothetical protein